MKINDITSHLKHIYQSDLPKFHEDWWGKYFDALTDVIIVINDDFQIIHANCTAQELLASASSDLYNQKCHFMLHQKHNKCSYCPIRESYFETDNMRYEEIAGKLFEIHIAQVELQDTKHYIIIGHDLSAERLTDNKLLSIIERYELTLKAINEGMWIIELPSLKISLNDSFFRIMGYKNGEIPENFDIWKLFLFEETVAPFYASLQDSIDNSKEFQQEIQVRTKDKTIKWITARGKVMISNADEKKRFYGTITDISERKNTELKLKEAQKRAEAADKLKTAFLTNMSHEIRTPMNAILGFSELIASNELEPSQRESFLDILRNSTQDLLNILDDILEVSKIQTEQIEIKKQACNLHNIFSDVMILVQRDIIRFGKTTLKLKIHNNLEDNQQIIESDEKRLKQIIHKLSNNSVKFTSEGIVEIGCYEYLHHTLLFYVKDTGIGIATKDYNIIFDRFRQVDDGLSRPAGGTGLGLAITQNLIKILGGKMWLESIVKKGCIFYFTLPVQYPEQISLPTPEHNKQTIESNKKEVLIIHPTDTNYELLNKLLKHEGISVVWTTNTANAREILQLHPEIQLVFTSVKIWQTTEFRNLKKVENKDQPFQVGVGLIFETTAEMNDYLNEGIDFTYSIPPVKTELKRISKTYITK